MKDHQKFKKVYFPWALLSIACLTACFTGCIKSSINPSDTEQSEPNIPEKEVVPQEKDVKDIEAKTATIKDAETEAAKLAEKKKQEIAQKNAKIADIQKQLAGLGYQQIKDPAKLKIAEKCLIIITKEPLAHDKSSEATLAVKKAQALLLMGKDREALDTINANQQKIILTGHEQKKTGYLNLSPAVEATFMQGTIYLNLASKETDTNKAKDLYLNSVKSFYNVLSNYDANKCPFFSPSVIGFKECRKEMLEKFKIKVGFPPEF